MKIYVFNVGQADAQLIVFPSGYSILIDTGEVKWNDLTNCNYVAKRLQEILGKSMHVNTIVISHTHLDHIGTIKYGGIWGLIERHGLTFDKLIDRNCGIWKDSNRDKKCDASEIQYKIIGDMSSTTDKWICWATADPIKSKREIAQLCSSNQMKPKDKGAKITVVGVDATGVLTSKGKPVRANWSAVKNGPSENAYSVGLLIQYGDFSYLTMGDMDGSYFSGNTYNDIESTVVPRVGPVDFYHVNHHGSPFSTCQALVDKTKPTAAVFSVGKNDYKHPGQETIDRLYKAGTEMFFTGKGVERNYRNGIIANGDVIVETDGKKYFTVSAGKRTKKYTSLKGTKFPACKDGDQQDKPIPTIKPEK